MSREENSHALTGKTSSAKISFQSSRFRGASMKRRARACGRAGVRFSDLPSGRLPGRPDGISNDLRRTDPSISLRMQLPIIWAPPTAIIAIRPPAPWAPVAIRPPVRITGSPIAPAGYPTATTIGTANPAGFINARRLIRRSRDRGIKTAPRQGRGGSKADPGKTKACSQHKLQTCLHDFAPSNWMSCSTKRPNIGHREPTSRIVRSAC